MRKFKLLSVLSVFLLMLLMIAAPQLSAQYNRGARYNRDAQMSGISMDYSGFATSRRSFTLSFFHQLEDRSGFFHFSADFLEQKTDTPYLEWLSWNATLNSIINPDNKRLNVYGGIGVGLGFALSSNDSQYGKTCFVLLAPVGVKIHFGNLIFRVESGIKKLFTGEKFFKNLFYLGAGITFPID